MTVPGDPAGDPVAPDGSSAAVPPSPGPPAPALPPYAYTAASSPYRTPAEAIGAPATPHAYGAPTAPAGAFQAPAYAPPAGWRNPPSAGWPAGSAPPPSWQPPRGPWPPGAPPAARSKTLARIALALAITGTVLAFVPIMSLLSGPFLLAAFIVSIVALASRKQGSKGIAAGALVLSIVAWIASVVVALTSWFAIPGADEYVAPPAPVPEYEVPYESSGGQIPLAEHALGPVSFDDSASWFVAIVETPEAAAGAAYFMVDIEALDASGNVLDHASGYVAEPHGTLAFEGIFYEATVAAIDSIVVRATTPPDSAAVAPDGTYRVGPLTATTDGYATTVTGTIRSTFAEDQDYVRVVVIARDAAGAIVGADTTYVERLPGGGESVVEAQFYEQLPAGTTFEAFASR